MSDKAPKYILLVSLLELYSDGNEHGWDAEFTFLRENHAKKLQALTEDVAIQGILKPISIGSDGRIWDGHHRLVVAKDLGLLKVPVIFV